MIQRARAAAHGLRGFAPPDQRLQKIERANDGARIAGELKKLRARPSCDLPFSRDEAADLFRLRQSADQSPVAAEIILRQHIEYEHHVDIALGARLAARTAALQARADDAPAENFLHALRIQRQPFFHVHSDPLPSLCRVFF